MGTADCRVSNRGEPTDPLTFSSFGGEGKKEQAFQEMLKPKEGRGGERCTASLIHFWGQNRGKGGGTEQKKKGQGLAMAFFLLVKTPKKGGKGEGDCPLSPEGGYIAQISSIL